MKCVRVCILVIFFVSVVRGEEIDEKIFKARNQDPKHHGDNGNVVVDLDILYTPEEWEFMKNHAIVGTKDVSRRDLMRMRRKAIIGKRWPGGLIKFDFKDKFSLKSRKVIAEAISDYQAYTCLRFEAAKSDKDNRISFTDGPGCQSHVGMKGGSQRLHLSAGCRTKGTIIHEMGHAIGWQHEQSRPDRDDHVKILWKNIQRGMDFNFNKYKKDVVPDWGVGYDYKSVMHYGPISFSKRKKDKLPTIQTLDPKYQTVIGQRESLSFADIKMANIMYNCVGRKCRKKTCPGNAFQGKDCECWCETNDDKNPVKHCNGDVIKAPLLEIKGLTDYESDCEDKKDNCMDFLSWCKSHFFKNEMKRDCPDTCGFC